MLLLRWVIRPLRIQPFYQLKNRMRCFRYAFWLVKTVLHSIKCRRIWKYFKNGKMLNNIRILWTFRHSSILRAAFLERLFIKCSWPHISNKAERSLVSISTYFVFSSKMLALPMKCKEPTFDCIMYKKYVLYFVISIWEKKIRDSVEFSMKTSVVRPKWHKIVLNSLACV